jgi:thiamine biosynthesis lipoprotein
MIVPQANGPRTHGITRRRMIQISAAAAGLSLVPMDRRLNAAAELVTWRGTALGAVATLQIHHPDRSIAQRLIECAIAEATRLEGLFSLYRPDSALVLLNRHGFLEAPAPDLVDLLAECRRYWELTRGAFDVTVQPLWSLYAGHFSQADAEPTGPPAEAVADAVARVGFGNVLFNRDRITFAKKGMQLTLNGIAQGYMTDRVVDLLRAHGIGHTLVDMGETRCLDAHPSGRPWQVAIADPDRPGAVRDTLAITNRAVATSGAYGFQFDAAGRFNHLFDPHTGASAHAYGSVTVVADTATRADALSTALSLLPITEIDRVLADLGTGSAHLILRDRTMVTRHA